MIRWRVTPQDVAIARQLGDSPMTVARIRTFAPDAYRQLYGRYEGTTNTAPPTRNPGTT